MLENTLGPFIEVAEVLNLVSLGSGLLILVILGVLAYHDHKMVNRISLRLTAAIALIDIVNHINSIFHWSLEDGKLCTLSGFLRVFGRQVFCFLNISIALNLHLILLCGLRPKTSWEKYYWMLSLVVPLAMNLPPLALGMFGHNGTRCLVRIVPHRKILLAINLPLVMLITFIYCTLITVLVMIRLRAKLKIVRNLSPNGNQMDALIQRNVEKSLKRLICRISLYPLTCVISMLFYFIANVWNLLFGESPFLLTLAFISLTLTGFLNLIAFLLDPTLHNAASSMWTSLKKNSYYNYSDSSSIQFMTPKPDQDLRTSIHGNNNLRLL